MKKFFNRINIIIIILVLLMCICGYLVGLLIWWEPWDI